MPIGDPRSEQIVIMVTVAEKGAILSRAERDDRTVSSLVRRLLRQEGLLTPPRKRRRKAR